MDISLESFGISDIGLIRSNNEDVFKALPDKRFYILADGMGGHNAGEIASSLALQSMCESLSDLPAEATVEEACWWLREAIAKANRTVFSQSRHRSEYAGMGTTLLCFVIVEDVLIYAHIGDSRLYRFRKKLDQLTEDHSLLQATGTEDVTVRNKITRAVGYLPTILPDIGVIPLYKKDIYLLCSDGLSDYVEKNTISTLLSSPLSLEEMGKKLVSSALENGGNDNITLLLVKVK